MSATLLELPSPETIDGGLWYATSAATRFGRHFHDEVELNLIVGGVVDYWFPHRELRIVAPSALWIPPGVEHELIGATDTMSMWVYSFRRRCLPSSLADVANLDEPVVTGLSATALTQLCSLSTDGLLRPSAEDFNVILAQAATVAWSGRHNALARQVDAACHPAARRAAALLRAADSPPTTQELARICRLSRERLSRLFTQSFGIGLVHYRNHHRVQRFIHEYGDGSEGNMLRAALDAGFGSYVQFYRAFKQVTGYAPATHLERVRHGIVDPSRTG